MVGERSQVFRLRERNRYSRLCFSIGFTSESSSACNHDPDVFPSKPVRPQIVNDPLDANGPRRVRISRVVLRLALLAALLLGCNVPMEDPEHLSSVGIERAPGTYTIRVTLPAGAKIGSEWDGGFLIDAAGVKYPAVSSTFTEGTSAPTTVTATFAIPPTVEPRKLLVGPYDIDFLQSRIHKRK